jgi:hypothetical protein
MDAAVGERKEMDRMILALAGGPTKERHHVCNPNVHSARRNRLSELLLRCRNHELTVTLEALGTAQSKSGKPSQKKTRQFGSFCYRLRRALQEGHSKAVIF